MWVEGFQYISSREEKNMRRMRELFKKTAAVLLSATMLVSVAGCSGKAGGSATPTEPTYTNSAPIEVSEDMKYKDTIHIALSQEAPTLDSMKSGTLCIRWIANGTIYEKLMTLDANGEPICELAESVEVNDDSSEYTFHLRKGVKFHNGKEMTAEDVVASMNRWIEGFATAKSLCGESRFERIDDYTVRIKLATSNATFLTSISYGTQCAIITTSEACGIENDSGYMTEYIGTGPYMFESWELGQYTRLVKFDGYVPYGDKSKPIDGMAGYKNAYTKYLEFDYVAEESTRVAGLQTGQYDVILNLTSDDKPVVESWGYNTITSEDGIVVLVCNKKEGYILSNPLIRKAINAAIDCAELMIGGYGDFGTVGTCYMDAAQAAWVTDAGAGAYNQHDIEKAKELLKESGYAGEEIKVLVPNLNGFSSIAELFRQEMEVIGVNVNINLVDFATSTALKNDPEAWDLWLISFSSVPLPSMKTFVSPTYAGWSVDDTLTSYLNEFNTSKSVDDAKAIWEKMQAYCLEDYIPAILLGHYNSAIAYSPKLKGINYYMSAYYWNAIVEE